MDRKEEQNIMDQITHLTHPCRYISQGLGMARIKVKVIFYSNAFEYIDRKLDKK